MSTLRQEIVIKLKGKVPLDLQRRRDSLKLVGLQLELQRHLKSHKGGMMNCVHQTTENFIYEGSTPCLCPGPQNPKGSADQKHREKFVKA
ncbi:hypothetical protein AVEN_210404-1 [Araneus ventricosus]|uniref:Uncharacterized protein n=1 Tax=Araneus ventricosus TaxID=182803 RepID=A0A4Y2UKZ3_ARAVE|nr:hypothetical protein AVEN_3006-1 [Araneus ventricosus]GBO13679.1 hypothetical protein AVEN_210404-1 [Araneus ventricosus]